MAYKANIFSAPFSKLGILPVIIFTLYETANSLNLFLLLEYIVPINALPLLHYSLNSYNNGALNNSGNTAKSDLYADTVSTKYSICVNNSSSECKASYAIVLNLSVLIF
jgi:hypothetical protein